MKTAAGKQPVVEEALTREDQVPNTDDPREDGSSSENHPKDHQDQSEDMNSFSERAAKHVARNPWTYFMIPLVGSLVLSVIGFVVGDFTVTADNTGWISRGTSIADQTTQLLLLDRYDDMLNGNNELWNDITTKVQDGFEDSEGEDEENTRRRQRELESTVVLENATTIKGVGFLGCEATSFYLDTAEFLSGSNVNLWPAWSARKDDVSLLDPKALEDICTAEQNTQAILQANNLCGGCGDSCFPPISIVLLARFYLDDFESKLSCSELAQSWIAIRSEVETDLIEQANALRASNTTNTNPFGGIATFFVDDQFGIDGNTRVRYSTSIFSSAWAGTIKQERLSREEIVDGLFELRSSFDRASSSDLVIGAYDTSDEDFLDIVVDELVIRDMSLALASAFVTILAMLIHTRSPWITLIGLAQIVISFPLSFFVYSILLRLTFFPFLNFIGVFITFALGSDDVFVACDKWKNARLDYPNASIEFIAAKALPDAAQAMFLTSFTTAIAFFSTAICPTTALKMFAIFLGLLISFDYILCVLLIFPALCLYDRWNSRGTCWCVAFGSNKSNHVSGEMKESLIRRILSAYYEIIHRMRYILLAVIVGATIFCCIVAARLDLPTTSEVRLLGKSHELEKVFNWKFNLFAADLDRKEGSRVWAVWGLRPADNGNPNDPTTSSTLVLDDSFDPSPVGSQLHLLKFCDDLFQQDFAATLQSYVCPMQRFDSWLSEQSGLNVSSGAYLSCGGASGVPVSPINFDACIIGFAEEQTNTDIYYRDGKVKIIRVVYRHSGVAYDSAYDIIDDAWQKLTTFLQNQNSVAPEGVDKVFASSLDFWWYDTNGSILSSALGSVAIALAAACVVVLLSSRSFEITLFATFTIGFILAAVTALLVGTGWTLGFLESVCFAILVGMSCDFVLHLGHAYSSRCGSVSRHERTKEGLLRMGPSILAAAVTTIAAAVVMMFTKIVFFQRFAVILLYSLLMGLVGSVFVFVVLTDIFGPAEPTVLVDSWLRCSKQPVPLQSIDKETSTNKAVTTKNANAPGKNLSPEILA